MVPRAKHIVEVIKFAYLDESVVSQERLGALCVRGNRVANFHADRIGLEIGS
jgi:hypothetical protein